MAELVATMVVGPLLSIVKEKASSCLLDQYKVMEGMKEQREMLKRKLLAILDVITDAEEAAAHKEGAKAWLETIKKVAYEANEVFDEFNYEALRRQAKEKGHYTNLGFHVIKLFPTHNRVAFRIKMGNKLRRIVQAIEVLVDEMNKFGFQHKIIQAGFAPPSKQDLQQWRQTYHDIFDPHKIISKSRGEDCKNIIDILLGQASNAALTVVPIVGIGGLGKTTLAQLVFNHPDVQKHFELLLWVCVSDSFDVNSLANTIVEALPKKKKDYTDADAQKKGDRKADFKKSTLDCLKDALSGQRYLLVLDDVWNREGDKWEKLKANLQYGGKGSAILTTTRDEGVANVMRTVEAYKLTGLKDKFIKEIIESRAFSLQKEEERPAVLVKMVGEIVKRCAGSPLAATALGSVLRTKNSEEEWEAVSRRSNICTEESGILPILKLSYNDLPSHMKQCFAFCAVFPKDYEIDVDKLIQLWIANGFIQEEEGVRLETIGKHIFSELASRSFFQDVKKVQCPLSCFEGIKRMGGCYWRHTCKIHDLMHDIAQSIMEKECAVAVDEESSYTKWLTNTARHLFLSCRCPQLSLNTSLNETSPAIQTLVCDSDMFGSLQHLTKYSSLRALRLCTRLDTFPLKPKHLHHLRYLDLSRSYIEALPEDISILYNLQTLNLSGCGNLNRLPRQMKYMTALRHLYTHGCPNLKSMPPGLSKLASLQTLTCFVAGTGSGCSNLRELQGLNLGEIELCQLENVTEEDAKAANLAEKKELRELTLKWTVGCEEDVKVLDSLEPHDGQLQAIRIGSYGGTTFPTWMGLLPKMTEIHLFHCKKVQYLFSRDTPFTFPNLKELTLKDLPDLERLSEINNGGPGEEIIFPHLEKFRISFCGKLSSLPGQPAFPNLQNACIKGCPLLKTQLEAPKLGVLDMYGGEEEMFLWVARHMTSLTDLTLDVSIWVDGHNLSQVMENREKWNHRKFPLAAMKLSGLVSGVAELCSCFLQLQDLGISRSDALVHWPEKEFQNLVSLRSLQISWCNKLTGFAQAAPPEPSTTSFGRSQLLPSLQYLEIYFCNSLVEMFNVPASLRIMTVVGCRKVESIFGRRQQQGMSESSVLQGSFVPEVPSSLSSDSVTEVHRGSEGLVSLYISDCPSFTGVLDLPPSLEKLFICGCDGLRSLESRSGALPSLEKLSLNNCETLSSLPDGPQAYLSLLDLEIRNCPGIKTLPTCLQQRLGSIRIRNWMPVMKRTNGSPRYGNMLQHVTPCMGRYQASGPKLLFPKTWKYAA